LLCKKTPAKALVTAASMPPKAKNHQVKSGFVQGSEGLENAYAAQN
jgi:hypothetical protein